MKTYGFNLLPQKPRSLVRKENKRDNYSVAIAILPLTGVIIWLGIILINFLIIEPNRTAWQTQVEQDTAFITVDLAPILVKNGEMVTKTNALAKVVDKDVKPEQLFLLIEQIYGNQDPTFKIEGYGRNTDGSFNVNFSAISYTRLAEITRRFSAATNIERVKLESASLNVKTNLVNGTISFFFNPDAVSTK